MRVLVVDLTSNFREILSVKLLTMLPKNSLLEKAASPSEALEKISLFHPDILLVNHTMISMKVDNTTFINHIKYEGNLPVIAYGFAKKDKVPYKALGVADYVEKTSSTDEVLIKNFVNAINEVLAQKPTVKPEFTPRVMTPGAAMTRATWKKNKSEIISKNVEEDTQPTLREKQIVVDKSKFVYSPPPKGTVELIAIGSSTGGTEALSILLQDLHPPLPPIVITQHIPALFAKLLAERLNEECLLSVQEGKDGEAVKNNTVYIAPGNLHMTIHRENGVIVTRVKTGPKVHSCRPSVDVMFKSVAENIGKVALGVILTGMGHDGAEGLLMMRAQGSYTLGQDKDSCVVYGMPKAAFDMGAVAKQLPLTSIAKTLEEIAR